MTKPPFIHESAYVDEDVELGEGTKVWHFAHVQKGARIGKNCMLGQNVNVGPGVRIGDGVKIQNNVSVYEGVELADDVFCGPSMVFTNVTTPRAFIVRKHEMAKTKVGKGATFGANCTVVCGHDVGEYALIAAGAVVTKNVPAYALIKGVPGRQAGWVCRCGIPLPATEQRTIACRECGSKYTMELGALHPADGNR